MDDLKLNSGTYHIGRFPNAITQLQVARRLGPIFVKMGSLVEAFEKLFPEGLEATPSMSNFDLKDILADVEPFAEALAGLPDDRFEYVINTCLATVSRETGGRFAPVMLGKQQMFEDIAPSEVMQLVFAVIQENLSNFMTAPR
jgi:hypothetical protein